VRPLRGSREAVHGVWKTRAVEQWRGRESRGAEANERGVGNLREGIRYSANTGREGRDPRVEVEDA